VPRIDVVCTETQKSVSVKITGMLKTVPPTDEILYVFLFTHPEKAVLLAEIMQFKCV
jgi:hypothetical protein